MGGSMKKQVKGVATHFVKMAVSISKAVPKALFQKDIWAGLINGASVLELDKPFRAKFCECYWIRCRIVCSSIGSALSSKSWYIQPIIYVSKYCSSRDSDEKFWECVVGCELWKKIDEKGGLGEVSNNSVLKADLRQFLSYGCSARKGTAWDVLFRLFKYQRIVSRFSVASDMDLRKMKENVS